MIALLWFFKRGAHLARENRLGPFGRTMGDHPIESKNPKNKNFGFERCARKVSYVVPRSEDIDLK